MKDKDTVWRKNVLLKNVKKNLSLSRANTVVAESAVGLEHIFVDSKCAVFVLENLQIREKSQVSENRVGKINEIYQVKIGLMLRG